MKVTKVALNQVWYDFEEEQEYWVSAYEDGQVHLKSNNKSFWITDTTVLAYYKCLGFKEGFYES